MLFVDGDSAESTAASVFVGLANDSFVTLVSWTWLWTKVGESSQVDAERLVLRGVAGMRNVVSTGRRVVLTI